MKIVFTDQYANLLFLINGLIILFYLGARKKKRQRAMKFGNYETLQKVAGKNFLKSSNVVLLIKMAALTSLIIGISNPVLLEEVPSSKSDYVIAVDSSGSMLENDIQPNRLEAAKSISNEFIGRLSEGTKVGIVSFSGDVKRESTLTENHEEVIGTMEGLETGSSAGTAIGDALFTASSMLLDANRSRTVILITDGENNVGSSLNESIEYAVSHNITVNAIGIGQKKETGTEFETINGVNATKARFPDLNVENLNRTASRTGGELVTATNRSSLESAFLSFEKGENRTDISIYFIFLALGLMLLEWMLGTTRYSILP